MLCRVTSNVCPSVGIRPSLGIVTQPGLLLYRTAREIVFFTPEKAPHKYRDDGGSKATHIGWCDRLNVRACACLPPLALPSFLPLGISSSGSRGDDERSRGGGNIVDRLVVAVGKGGEKRTVFFGGVDLRREGCKKGRKGVGRQETKRHSGRHRTSVGKKGR